MILRKMICLTIFTSWCGFVSPAAAQLLVNPAHIYEQHESGVELLLGKSYTKFSVPLEILAKTDNTFFSGSYAYGLGKHLNVYGAAAFVVDSSLEAAGMKYDGDGMAFALGLKGNYPRFNYQGADFSWYAQISKADLDFDDGPSGDLLEITAGVLLKKEIKKGVIGYAGLEYVINSDANIDFPPEKEDGDPWYEEEDEDDFLSEIDGERKDKLGIKLGLIFPMDRFNFSVNAGLMNELSINVGVSIPFGGGSKPVSSENLELQDGGGSVIGSAQQRLHDLGYDPGPLDGIAGDRFHNALTKFQRDAGLLETGTLNSATRKALGLE